MLIKMIPFVFVILWSSGFVGARLVLNMPNPQRCFHLGW